MPSRNKSLSRKPRGSSNPPSNRSKQIELLSSAKCSDQQGTNLAVNSPQTASTPTITGVPEPRAQNAPRHATGPRTRLGKQRSRYNSRKHGIFSVGVIPGLESVEEYHALVDEFVQSLRPFGRVEEIIVEKLAIDIWCYRRLLRAEGRELGNAEATKEEKRTTEISSKEYPFIEVRGCFGTALVMRDRDLWLNTLERMVELRQKIRSEGPNWHRDRDEIASLFGKKYGREEIPPSWRRSSDKAEEEIKGSLPKLCWLMKNYREQPPSDDGGVPTGSAVDTLSETDSIMTQLIDLLKESTKLFPSDFVDDAGSRSAALLYRPLSADLFLRYRAALERSIDRGLRQLETLQRMRRGQPAPPSIEVNISS